MNVTVNLSKNARQIQSETQEVNQKTGFYSRLFDLHISNILKKCRSSNITIDDLPALENRHYSNKVMSGYRWKRRVIFSILLKFWKSFVFAFAFRVAAIFSDYASILLLKYLIDSAEVSSALFNFFIISFLILFFLQLKSVLLGFHTYLIGEDCALVTTVLNNVIVKKALNLSCENNEWNRQKIKKLLTTHSEAISNALIYVHHSFSALIELTIALFWIWETLGTRTIIAVIVVAFLYLLLNVIDSYVYRKSLRHHGKCRDKRVEFEKTLLNSMDTVKLFSWEPRFLKNAKSFRSLELAVLRKSSCINSVMHSLNVTSPFVIMFVCFAVYGLQYDISLLRFEDAFVLIAVFNYMRRPLHLIIPSLEFLNKAFHSATRINQFLVAKPSPKVHQKNGSHSSHTQNDDSNNTIDIKLESACFSWDGKNPILSDITLEVQKGSVHAFIGLPLCGKSSLMFSIAGELKLTRGKMFRSNRISFAPAVPHIFSQTVRDNILFGNVYVKAKFDKVVAACDLKKDIFSFPKCDATILNEKGYVLSATQRAQISLARCLYEDADIYALDKAFATMDQKTARRIFDRVLGENGYLNGKTVVMATNNIELTKKCTIHVMKEGRVEQSGSYEELLESSTTMSGMLKQSEIDKRIEEKYFDQAKPPRKTVMFNVRTKAKKKEKDATVSMEQDLFTAENRSVFWFYFSKGSFICSAFYIALLFCRFAFQSLTFFWLSFWLDPVWKKSECDNCPQYVFIQTMSFFALSAIVATVLSYTFFVFTNVASSRKLYHIVISALLQVPHSFLNQSNKDGFLQILSSDLDVADTQFPLFAKFAFESALHLIMIFTIVCINVPFFAIFVIAFFIFIAAMLKFFLPAFKKISSLEGKVRDVFLIGSIEHFEGRLLVRIFGKSREIMSTYSEQADLLTRCRVAKSSAMRWLSLRTELMSNLIVASCLIISSICLKVGYIGNAQFALSVAVVLCISELVSTFIRVISSLQSVAPHIQRISNMRDCPKELTEDKCTIRDSWPDDGSIEIRNLNVFADKYKHVIKDVSLTIDPREKLGIIGKPGCGKTQLALTLIGMSSADSESEILVDGLNIFDISVQTLRSRITIIPQKAKVFSDTLGNNIDPCCQFADSDIWLVIEACQLREFVTRSPEGLHQNVSESSMNDEEKCQLNICRALLKGGQIFVVDNSTKLMSDPTKALVDEAIRQNLRQSTTVFIGDDFRDIEHCERVVVMENGVILAIDKPENLISKYGSLETCLLNLS